MSVYSRRSNIARLGFHYYPDSLHYSDNDLTFWLPELQQLGASWLTLVAPGERAIPEFFIDALLNAGITPILHFKLPLDIYATENSIELLFNTYARWGIRYVALFDRPNLRKSWSVKSWVEVNLVERFLDLFIPYAAAALRNGLIPLFSPLQPGGDFWDTAFIKAALLGLKKRGQEQLLSKMILGVCAYTGNRPVNWGQGGPERWPGARPYSNAPGIQNQVGFRIFEWYSAISEQVVGKRLPLLLLQAGCRMGEHNDLSWPAIDEVAHAQKNMEIASYLVNDSQNAPDDEYISPDVISCNFWLLAADKKNEHFAHSWYFPEGNNLIVVDQMKRWAASFQRITNEAEIKSFGDENTGEQEKNFLEKSPKNSRHPIKHYLLMPLYSWGAAEWDLELIQPVLEEFHPTIGFSLTEASLASRVTVVGNSSTVSEDAIDLLKDAGCQVERLLDDGMLVAS